MSEGLSANYQDGGKGCIAGASCWKACVFLLEERIWSLVVCKGTLYCTEWVVLWCIYIHIYLVRTLYENVCLWGEIVSRRGTRVIDRLSQLVMRSVILTYLLSLDRVF